MECLKMTKLHGLNVFLTERLMSAAQDIYKAVETTILEYQGEIVRERRENDQLKRKLREAGIAWPDREPYGSLEFEEEEFLPIVKEPEPQASPTPEKQEYDTRTGEAECGSLDSKSTSIPHGNSNYTPDQTSVALHEQHHSHLEDPHEEDFVSISPSNQIKVETCVPGPCPVPPTDGAAESLSLNAECAAAPSDTAGVGAMESERLLSRFDAVQFPQHLFQLHDAAALGCAAYAKPCRRFGHLNSAAQLHAGDRGFLCGLCGKTFSSSGRLKGHQRIHTGEKPYQCHVCMKRFNQTAHLKVHLRVHTGEKPFSCPVCGKCFTQSNKVKRHLITHARD